MEIELPLLCIVWDFEQWPLNRGWPLNGGRITPTSYIWDFEQGPLNRSWPLTRITVFLGSKKVLFLSIFGVTVFIIHQNTYPLKLFY